MKEKTVISTAAQKEFKRIQYFITLNKRGKGNMTKGFMKNP
jgi:hypothetical protein